VVPLPPDSRLGGPASGPLPERRRAAALTFVGYSANTAILTVQAFLLIPLYLRYVGVGLYGAWVATGGLLVWLQVLDLGFPNLLIQRVGAAYGRGDAGEAKDYFHSGTVVIVMAAAVLAAVGVGLSPLLPSWMHVRGDDAVLLREAFLVGLAGSMLALISNAFVGLGRALQETGVLVSGLVVGSTLGFAVTLALLLAGLGLWAIPLGILARSTVVFATGIVFAVGALRRLGRERHGRVRVSLVREYLTVAPPSGFGTVAYGAMGQGETTLIALVAGTDAGLVYSLTRRVADAANGVVDTIGFGSYGGFAHLVGSGEHHRVRAVVRELSSLRLSLSLLAGAVVLAANRSFISLWVGKEYFGGDLLNLLVVVQLVVVGQSYLYNNLYRASGPVLRGSVALSAEGALRFGGVALLLVAGVAPQWVPLMGAVAGLGFGWWYRGRLLGSAGEGWGRGEALRWGARLVLVGAALAAARMMSAGSWLSLVLVGLLWAGLGALAIGATDKAIVGAGKSVVASLRRRRRERG
jgi:Na+-driven multidrug efflux pump